MSQAASEDLADKFPDHDFETMMSQVDETEYAKISPKSKVKNWVSKENFTMAKIDGGEKFQIAPNKRNFEQSSTQSMKRFCNEPRVQNENNFNMASNGSSLMGRINHQAQQRQDFLFKFISKEQQLEEKKLYLIEKAMYIKK